MKSFLIYLSFLCLSLNAFAQNTWVQIANAGTTVRSSAVGFSIDGFGYIGTGYTIGWSALDDFWKYDTLTNAWTQVASINGARLNSFCFVINGKGYVGGGAAGPSPLHDMQVYDPQANLWSAVSSYPGPINAGIGMTLNNEGYVYNFSGTNNFYRYDPLSNSWSPEANFPGLQADGASAFAIGDDGYIMTGWLGGIPYRTIYMFSSITHTWTQKNNFPISGRWDASTFTINNKGYYGLGMDSATIYHNDFWEYNPVNDSWEQVASLPGNARYQGVAFSIGNCGYAGTGLSLNDFYKYCPLSTSIQSPKGDFFSIKVVDHSIIISLDSNFDYQLFSISGKLISSGKAFSRITIPNLLQGIYMVRVNNLRVVKVVVE
jgi:N-acetylneuraminic acid mutarotase